MNVTVNSVVDLEGTASRFGLISKDEPVLSSGSRATRADGPLMGPQFYAASDETKARRGGADGFE